MSKGEETKLQILEHATRLASSIGLEGVSIGRLAEELQLSKSGVFAHFQSKEALQVQILQYAKEQFVARVIAPSLKAARGEPRVRALIDNWLAWGKSDWLPGGCLFVAAAVELDDQPGLARDTLVYSQRDWLDSLAQAARIAVSMGHFRSDLDVDQFAHDQYAIILGFQHASRLMKDPKAESRARSAFEALIQNAHPRTGKH